MNLEYEVLADVVYDLTDAREELDEILELFDTERTSYDEDEFKVRMAHLYWHLNSAWNKRKVSAEDLENADGNQMNIWGEFPKDLKPL